MQTRERGVRLQHVKRDLAVTVSESWDLEALVATSFRLRLNPAVSAETRFRALAAANTAMHARRRNSQLALNLEVAQDERIGSGPDLGRHRDG